MSMAEHQMAVGGGFFFHQTRNIELGKKRTDDRGVFKSKLESLCPPSQSLLLSLPSPSSCLSSRASISGSMGSTSSKSISLSLSRGRWLGRFLTRDREREREGERSPSVERGRVCPGPGVCDQDWVKKAEEI
jgi:hypothetical protein